MLTRRNWLLRFSIILNVAAILYIGTNMASKNNACVVLLEKLQASRRNLASIDTNDVSVTLVDETNTPSNQAVDIQNQIGEEFDDSFPAPESESSTSTSTIGKPTSNKETVNLASSNIPEEIVSSSNQNTPSSRQLEDIIRCYEKEVKPTTAQRGEFWVLYNYVPAKRTFRCFESITYTTHSDYTFLDNLQPLLERWRGPVSLAMHAPGTDFAPTVEAIRYARDCLSPLVSELVTFHIFFGMRNHVPRSIPPAETVMLERADCTLPPPWENVTSAMLYKNRRKILYPVNVGRNVARDMAATHFILASDIELYPSPGVIPDFLEMIRRQEASFLNKNPKVYTLSIFEFEKGQHLPQDKSELVNMMKTNLTIPFHKNICPQCHNVPMGEEWVAANQTEGLHVFHIGKRTGQFTLWEPIFIGTHDDPRYDERLSWDGKRDKMPQGYAMCVLDYEFHILDNAFLVHKPGIKNATRDKTRDLLTHKTDSLIRTVIFPELKVLYGKREGCTV